MTMTTELDELMPDEKALFSVVHPLDDVPEEKVDTENLGPMHMTRTVRSAFVRPTRLPAVDVRTARISEFCNSPARYTRRLRNKRRERNDAFLQTDDRKHNAHGSVGAE